MILISIFVRQLTQTKTNYHEANYRNYRNFRRNYSF
jgi:hypothetical protein